MRTVKHTDLDEKFFKYLEIEEIEVVKEVIEDVQKNGDAAVKKYTKQFDYVDLDQFIIKNQEIKNAYSKINADEIDTIKFAAENIKNFAIEQKRQFVDFEFEIKPGVFAGQKVIPIERIGVYTPGGNYPLPSTVLMCCIPAKIAGATKIVLCSPPTYDGSLHPAILVAANICEVDVVYKIGGVQAVAAMAYGTETVKTVDKIVGPGNKYVTAAKKHVFGVVGIDFIAGPTELLIIADNSANPAFIVADLLGQAEHDVIAEPILVTDSVELADAVNVELEKQLSELTTAPIARQSLETNGIIILVDSIDDAVDVANKKAPEHLELQVAQLGKYSDKLKNYGSLFIGSYAAEVYGDYSSGLNHTLPTNRSARYTGGLSVKDFLKIQTTLRVEKDGIDPIATAAAKLGEIEGLEGHTKSALIRLPQRHRERDL